MPIERLDTTDAGDDQVEPGQQAYEAIQSVALDVDELTMMGLLASVQRRTPWAKLSPEQRAICVYLEQELFDEVSEA